VIIVAVRWYLRFNLSYRDVEELLVECGVEVDHVSVFRWVQRFTPLLADAARFCRHAPGDRWYVDETYVKVNGIRRYVYRAVDQHGQVIDVLVAARRDADAARRFFRRALAMLKVIPAEVVTDAAAVYLGVLDELIPSAWHHVEQYANNPIEADHSQLKHRLRPMRGLRTDRTTQEAADRYTAALAMATHPDSTASVYHNLAGLAHAQGRFADAVTPARTALALHHHLHGPTATEVAADAAVLGAVLLDLGHLDEAEAQLRHAYRIWVARFGPDHYETAVCLHSLGVAQYRRHRPETGRQLLARALRIKTTVLGPDHPEISRLRHNLAVMQTATGTPAEPTTPQAPPHGT
jgi:transposase-like protein